MLEVTEARARAIVLGHWKEVLRQRREFAAQHVKVACLCEEIAKARLALTCMQGAVNMCFLCVQRCSSVSEQAGKAAEPRQSTCMQVKAAELRKRRDSAAAQRCRDHAGRLQVPTTADTVTEELHGACDTALGGLSKKMQTSTESLSPAAVTEV
jgi:hypothetical protein